VYAFELGSDCPFFIENKPKYVTEKGNHMEAINLDLSDCFIYIIKPELHVGTSQAYQGISPKRPVSSLMSDIEKELVFWKNDIKNDFEPHIFNLYPNLSSIKKRLYDIGAVYAAMSGSGSTLFGIFKSKPQKLNKYPFEKILEL
jgi:4-diphosphocytidyl-2-C-methyl-D-erythritol kinase